MKTATVTEFRQNIKEHLEEIELDQDILILSRPKKKGFVVLTLERYEAMEETAHLLSTPANAAHLMESIKQASEGNVLAKDLNLDDKSVKKRTAKGKR